MDTTENNLIIEPVTVSDVLATWDQPRSTEELRELIAEKEERAANTEEISRNRMPFDFLRAINY